MRFALIKLLCRIKTIRNIHFYNIVSVDDLLNRMVLDQACPRNTKGLTELFIKSYFPQDKSSSSQLGRCVSLVERNPDAALIFFGSVKDFASVGEIAKLMVLVVKCLLLRRQNKEEEEETGHHYSVRTKVQMLKLLHVLLSSIARSVCLVFLNI